MSRKTGPRRSAPPGGNRRHLAATGGRRCWTLDAQEEPLLEVIRAAADLVEQRYRGDLCRLRDEYGGADVILNSLQEVKGIGGTGVEIFVREA